MTQPTHDTLTSPDGQPVTPDPCPHCGAATGPHGPVLTQGPPWNPWGWEWQPCPRGQ